MQQPMDSCVCGINTSSESILIMSYIYFSRDKHVPVEFWYTYFTRNVNLKKRENLMTLNLYHKRGMHSLLHDIPRFLILFLEELILIFNQLFSIRAFGRRVIVVWLFLAVPRFVCSLDLWYFLIILTFLLGSNLQFHSSFKSTCTFGRQTLQNPTRCRILWCLI